MFLKVHSLKQQIRRLLHSFWCKVGYYNGSFYKFIYIDGKLTLKPIEGGKKPKILVVASNVYSEQNSSLPVVDSKELRKLLKLQSQANQAALVCEIQSDKSIINKWQFPQFEHNPLFIFPESILLTKGCTNTEILITKNNNIDSIYAKVGSVTYSGQLKGVINTEKRFAMSIGMQVNDVITLSQEDKLKRIEEGFKRLTLKEVTAFAFMGVNTNWSQLIIKLLLPGMVFISTYLLVASLFLTGQTYYLDYQNESIKTQVGDLLSVQVETEQKEQQYLTYIDILKNQMDYSGLLVSLVPVFDQVRLTSIVYENGRFIIRGEIDKASDMLEIIAKEPNIQDAKFDFPVIKSRARERFTISFVLKNELTIPELKRITKEAEKEKTEELKNNG
ncbi:hypothetical protein [Pseudoalteromonas sp. TB64]|uniref:hypothetical protein n=1 Tax=Pseudoalteromonas sp. TB64 TaxID=1938600 RepID=UPI0004168705|nr:hypothetical protein [Pseudoalteromonas sp. TB64]